MLAIKWKRQGELLQNTLLSNFLKSQWSYWEPWVDLKLHQMGLSGEQRKASKNHFQSRHQSTVEYLYRLHLSAHTIRLWKLDNPLMTEEARSLQLKYWRTSLTTSSGVKEPKKPKMVRWFVDDRPRKVRPKFAWMTPAEIEEFKTRPPKKRGIPLGTILIPRCQYCKVGHHWQCRKHKSCRCKCNLVGKVA
jgi:hypothetical protein